MGDGSEGGRVHPRPSEQCDRDVDDGQKEEVPVKAAPLFGLVHHDQLGHAGFHEEQDVKEHCWDHGYEWNLKVGKLKKYILLMNK